MATDKERVLAEITSQWGIRYGMPEVINTLQPWVGMVARNKALEAWRTTFRPDLPTI